MSRRETRRVAFAQQVSRPSTSFGSRSVASRALGRTFCAYALAAISIASCNSAKTKQGARVDSTAAPGAAAVGGVGPVHEHDHEAPAGEGGAERAQPASPSALSSEARPQLTMILVSAHVGSVIARRESGRWVISGRDGCAVDPERMKRALDNLSTLKVVPTTEAVPAGAAFQLQITAQVGEKRVVHLEIADRDATGHLTRLDNDSMVRLQGLDVGLWSPHPADWCRGP